MMGFNLPKINIDKIDSAIERLTEISGDLKSMIAVHESRITQQERNSEELYSAVEERRIELDNRMKEMYQVMKEKDNDILEVISEMREEAKERHKSISDKINSVERYIWVAIGGVTVVTWSVAIASNYFKLLIK